MKQHGGNVRILGPLLLRHFRGNCGVMPCVAFSFATISLYSCVLLYRGTVHYGMTTDQSCIFARCPLVKRRPWFFVKLALGAVQSGS